MARKGMKQIFAGLFGAKAEPPKPAAKAPATPGQLQKAALITRLRAMDPDDLQNWLAPEKARELNLPGLLRWAEKRLQELPDDQWDARDPEEKLTGFIRVLDAALQERLEMTAEYACAALVCAIGSLYVNIPGLGPEDAGALTECRAEYARKLRELAAQCMEIDRLARQLEKNTAHRGEIRAELDQLRADYIARRDAGRLDAVLAELQSNMHDPAALSDEALDLRDTLSLIHQLFDLCICMDEINRCDQLTIDKLRSRFSVLCTTLTDPPHVHDPKLQSRIYEVNRLYREYLHWELDRAGEELLCGGIQIDSLPDIIGKSIQITICPSPIIPTEQWRESELRRLQLELTLAAEQKAPALGRLESCRDSVRELRRILAARNND